MEHGQERILRLIKLRKLWIARGPNIVCSQTQQFEYIFPDSFSRFKESYSIMLESWINGIHAY